MKKFQEIQEKNIKMLESYVPVVERVHGGEHPEFHDLARLFEKINKKIKESDLESLELEEEFKEIRKVTDNYTIPENICESYEAVYDMLEEIDKAYNKVFKKKVE